MAQRQVPILCGPRCRPSRRDEPNPYPIRERALRKPGIVRASGVCGSLCPGSPTRKWGAVPALQPCPSLWDRDLSAVGSCLERPHPHGASLLEDSLPPEGGQPPHKRLTGRASSVNRAGHSLPPLRPSSHPGAHRRFREQVAPELLPNGPREIDSEGRFVPPGAPKE